MEFGTETVNGSSAIADILSSKRGSSAPSVLCSAIILAGNSSCGVTTETKYSDNLASYTSWMGRAIS